MQVSGRARAVRWSPLRANKTFSVAMARLLLVLAAVLAGLPALMPAAAAAAQAARAGSITIYPGISDPQAITAGPDGAMWFTQAYTSGIGRITTSETP